MGARNINTFSKTYKAKYSEKNKKELLKNGKAKN
jgi:hypothetical protein